MKLISSVMAEIEGDIAERGGAVVGYPSQSGPCFYTLAIELNGMAKILNEVA